VLSIIGLAGAWSFSCYQTSTISWPREPFTPNQWKRSAPENRYVFFRSLREQHLLDDARKAEVVELLGTPTYEAPDGLYMTYAIKQAEPSEISFNFVYLLSIEFDRESQRVVSYGIRSD